MRPQAQQVDLLEHRLRRALRHALEDLGQVAQVERVVRLGRGGQQLPRDRVEDVDGRLHDAVAEGGALARESVLVEVPVEDRLEDALERRRGVVGRPHEVEVADVARRDRVAPAAGRAHRGHELDVDELSEGAVLEIVPAVVVHPLTKDLYGRLVAVGLEHGHVEVVDEDDRFLAKGRSEDTLAPLVQLVVDEVLRGALRRLRREADEDVVVHVFDALGGLGGFGVDAVEDAIAHEHRLARARVAREQHGDAVRDARVHDVTRLHRIDRGDEDVAKLGALGHRVLGHRLRPVDPRPRARLVEAAVEDCALVHGRRLGELHVREDGLRGAGRREDLGHLLLEQLLEEKVELFARGRVDGGAHAPDEGEEEEALQDLGALLRVGRTARLLGHVDPDVEVRLDEAHDRDREHDVHRGHGRAAVLAQVPEDRVEEPVEEHLE